MKFGYYQSSMVSLAVSSGAPRCIVGASRGVQLANGYHRVLLSGVEFAIHHRLMELSPSARRKREYMPCSCSSVPIESSHSFHQSRLRKSSATFPKNPVQLQIRVVERDDEIDAVSWLRAKSFYAYPEERKFAGEIHQMMIAEEESKALRACRLEQKLGSNTSSSSNKFCSIVALCKKEELDDFDDENLIISDDGETQLAVVSTLDVHASRALAGEVLIASCSNAAYLANVCTAPQARRRGVGEAMVRQAIEIARSWSIEDIFVHTMAVNEAAIEFYYKNGFCIEKEETSNQAHYRGRCLDGIEGRGRTVLLRLNT